MEEYVGIQAQKSKFGTTMSIVVIIHLFLVGGLLWLASTQTGKEWIEAYKVNLLRFKEQAPPPAKAPEPPPPEAPAPEPVVELPPPPVETAAPAPVAPPVTAPVKLPGFGNPFSGGKAKKFAGYTDLITSEIQRLYKQPPDLPDDLRLAILFQLIIDPEGQVVSFKLLNSSGNPLFDRSAIQALSQLKKLRPPPENMSGTIVVKFYPPS